MLTLSPKPQTLNPKPLNPKPYQGLQRLISFFLVQVMSFMRFMQGLQGFEAPGSSEGLSQDPRTSSPGRRMETEHWPRSARPQ